VRNIAHYRPMLLLLALSGCVEPNPALYYRQPVAVDDRAKVAEVLAAGKPAQIFALAINLEKQNRADLSAQLYQALVSRFPGDYYAGKAAEKLASAQPAPAPEPPANRKKAKISHPGGTAAVSATGHKKGRTLSGVVATGQAANNGRVCARRVYADDLEDDIDCVNIDAMGGYMFENLRDKLPPLTLRAEWTVKGYRVHLFTVAVDRGGNVTANVTPITDMVTRVSAADSTGATDDESVFNAPPSKKLDTIVAGTKTMLGPQAPANPFTDHLDPSNPADPYDRYLENTRIAVKNGTVTVADAKGAPLAAAPFGAIASNTVKGDDQIVTPAKMKAAEVARADLLAASGSITVSPNKAITGQQTTFTVTGGILPEGTAFRLEGCGDWKELPGGTTSKRQFSCVGPTEAVNASGLIKDKPYGTTLYGFHVVFSSGRSDPPSKPPAPVTPVAPPAPIAQAGQPALPGTMILTDPFHALTKFKFPDAPASFSKNKIMETMGITQVVMVFRSETVTKLPDGTSGGPIRITLQEPASTEREAAVGIRIDSASSNGLYGELVPVKDGGMCHLSGANSQSMPDCAALGINFDKKAGPLTFTRTQLYPLGLTNVPPTKIVELTLSFPPY